MTKRKIKKPVRITKALVEKVLETVDAGLVAGLGRPEPGYMCVEAAVAYAMGEPHTDDPSCVTRAISNTKVEINDSDAWNRFDGDVNARRAKVLRRLAVAQLGSRGKITDAQWIDALNAYAREKNKDYLITKKKAIKELEKALTNMKADKEIPDDMSFMDLQIPDYDELISDITTEKQLAKLSEDLVQILIKLKSPGTKFLYLTEKKKPIKKVVKKTK